MKLRPKQIYFPSQIAVSKAAWGNTASSGPCRFAVCSPGLPASVAGECRLSAACTQHLSYVDQVIG